MKALMVVAATLVAAVVQAGTSSTPTQVFLNAEDSYLWRTAPSATFTVQWENPEGVPATLQVTGRGYSKTYSDLTATSQQLALPAAADDASENVFTLTLTLGDDVKTAQIAVVRGVGVGGEAQTAAYRDVNASEKRWAKFRDHAVLPIPAGTKAFSIDGQTVDTGLKGAAGWYMLQGVNINDEYTLALDGEEVTVRNRSGGLVIVVQ